MVKERNRLYAVILIACSAGYIWLYYMMSSNASGSAALEMCLVKHVTGVPCPSCGSTRAVISLTQGNFLDAVQFNPIGYLIAAIMLVAPIWIIADLIRSRKSFLYTYQRLEFQLKKPRYALLLIFAVLANWVWTVTKGL